MAVRPSTEEGRLVKVRLSDISLRLRRMVADELVRREKLRGLEALKLELAAQDPQPTMLTVPAWKAQLVLREGKRPPGPTPKYGR